MTEKMKAMAKDARNTMTMIPGVDAETMQEIADMKARTAEATAEEAKELTETLFKEQAAVRGEFRTWTF